MLLQLLPYPFSSTNRFFAKEILITKTSTSLKKGKIFLMKILGINPYIVTDGRGKEAIAFYQQALDAQVLDVKTFADIPTNPEYSHPKNAADLILNAHLKIGQTDVMISDTSPGQVLPFGDQVTLALTTDNVEKTKAVLANLQVDGQVLMALAETFWSPLYGQVKDKFGITWHITTDVEPTTEK
jgi:PhnB protein